jgi:precorrin-2 methylase
MKQKPMMYVVGVGCGDPKLLTNEAISIMAKADFFVSKDDYQKTFATYIAGRPVLFDPFMQLARYQKARHPELTDAEAGKKADAVYADNIQMLRKALKEGKVVALLEPGDPALYGGWRNWLSEYIPKEQLTVIAGMSSFSVANAVLGEYDLTRKPIIIAEPEELKANEPLIQAAAQNGSVIVVFMGLNRMKSLVPLLGRYFPPDTPLIIVYYAGIAGKERRIQTSLSKAKEVADAEKENFLGLIYIGRDLKDLEKPSR